jgi:hypothetical protein
MDFSRFVLDANGINPSASNFERFVFDADGINPRASNFVRFVLDVNGMDPPRILFCAIRITNEKRADVLNASPCDCLIE